MHGCYLFLMGHGRRPIGMQQGACNWGCIVVLVAWFGYQLPLITNAMHQWKWLPGCRSLRIYSCIRTGGSEWVGWGQQNGSPLRPQQRKQHMRMHAQDMLLCNRRAFGWQRYNTSGACSTSCLLPALVWSLNAVVTGPHTKQLLPAALLQLCHAETEWTRAVSVNWRRCFLNDKAASFSSERA
jgi:hypothetical protein